MEINIVTGTAADIDELEALYNDINDALEVGTNYPGWKKDVYPIRENAVAGVSEENLYIAKYDNKTVGSVILNHKPENVYNSVKWKIDEEYNKILVVRTFVVHPKFSRLGIGEKLMEFTSELAIHLNMKSIRLDVYEKNEPAIKLYEKCGYEYIGKVDLGLRNYGLEWFKLYEKVL